MANDIKIDLKLTGEQAVARGLDNVGDKADKAGDDLKGMAADAAFLDKRLDELRVSTKELAAEFARTGDQDIFKKFKEESRELGQLERMKKKFFTVAAEVTTEVAAATSKGLFKGLSEMGSDMKNAMGAAKGPLIGGAVALGAALTPFLGAAIASAVLGGAGAGGIIGGIALAARDSQVQAEAAKLGEQVAAGLTVVGEPFVRPTIDAIHVLGKEFNESSDDMREALATIAPVLRPLTEGLGGLVEKSLPGLTKGLEAAKPVLRVIANELPDVGDALGDFFEDISEDPDGAIMAMKALFQITTGVIRGTGELVGWLERAFETTQRWGVSTTGVLEDVFDFLANGNPLWGLAADGAAQAKENYEDQLDALNRSKDASNDFRNVTEQVTTTQYRLGGALHEVNGELEVQREAMRGLVDVHLSLRRATQDIEEAIDGFSESVRENGRSLDISTEKGRNNRDSIEAGIDALLRGEQAAYNNARATGATSLEAEEAAKRYRSQWIPALEAAAVKAGFNRDEVKRLLEILEKLDGRRITYTLVQKGGKTIGAKVDGGFIPAGFEERASGGPVFAGQLYKVGENGPEFIQMGSTDGYVYNASQTAAMVSGASGGASAPIPIALTIKLEPPPGMDGDVIGAIISGLQVRIAAQGGVVQTVLGQS